MERPDLAPLDRVRPENREPATWGQPAPLSNVATWLGGLLQAGDSFYPTGSYAHSLGLEGLVQEGVVRDRETLHTFLLRAVIPASRHIDLPIAAHAWRAFNAGNWQLVGELCLLSSALKTAREIRVASANIGRQRVELAAKLRDSALAQEFIRRSGVNAWPSAAPVAAALEGAVMGSPMDAVLVGIYYTSLASVLSAAMKILRLGQNSCQSLLTEALSLAPGIVAAAHSTPIEEIGWFNPWLDIASARHETADARMFIS